MVCCSAGAVWGNTFVQGLKVGLASYHFIAEDGEGEGEKYFAADLQHSWLTSSAAVLQVARTSATSIRTARSGRRLTVRSTRFLLARLASRKHGLADSFSPS